MIYPLPHYGSLSIIGTDAKKFLQGQLTCDLDKLAPNKSIMGAHCNPKGRIISLFYCLFHNDIYSLIMPQDMLPIAASALKKYAPFFKVTCLDTTQLYHFEGMTTDELNHLASTQNHIIEVNSSLAIVITPNTHEQDAVSETAWDAQLIAEKIPVLAPSTSQTFLPHELNLEAFNAVAFDKGCYTGQEIIARMHYRSQLAYQLHLATTQSETELSPGIDVYDSQDDTAKVIGRVVNIVETAPNEYQLLLTIKEPLPDEPFYLNAENKLAMTLHP